MIVKFQSPKELGIKEKTVTTTVALLYEDDDTLYKYPTYQSLPPNLSKNYFLKEVSDSERWDYVFIVLKNSDFTEGRGPMVVDKVFRSVIDSENYVASKPGIYGSGQHRSVTSGVDINGKAYVYANWNGYDIVKYRVEAGFGS